MASPKNVEQAAQVEAPAQTHIEFTSPKNEHFFTGLDSMLEAVASDLNSENADTRKAARGGVAKLATALNTVTNANKPWLTRVNNRIEGSSWLAPIKATGGLALAGGTVYAFVKVIQLGKKVAEMGVKLADATAVI